MFLRAFAPESASSASKAKDPLPTRIASLPKALVQAFVAILKETPATVERAGAALTMIGTATVHGTAARWRSHVH